MYYHCTLTPGDRHKALASEQSDRAVGSRGGNRVRCCKFGHRWHHFTGSKPPVLNMIAKGRRDYLVRTAGGAGQ